MKPLNRTLLLLSIIFLFIPSCSPRVKSETESLSEIYSSVLAYDPWQKTANNDYCFGDNLVIGSETVSENLSLENDWQWAINNFPQLSRDTWENFITLNQRPAHVSSEMNLGCKYTLLNTKEESPDWSKETCVNNFSQVGFNARRNQALVYIVSSCGETDFDTLYFLEVIDGHWKITDYAEGAVT